jgi:glycerophosphoryl diester phosphodiesterase
MERSRQPDATGRGPSEGLPRPLIFGHRGAAGLAPENTLAAFELALAQGADGIEFDVRLSADGEPVVIHDQQLDRTTSGTGFVQEYSAKVLKALDAGSWFNQRHPAKARGWFVRQRIPLLEELLTWVRKRGCRALLEIKQGSDAYQGIEAKILRTIRHTATAPLVTVVSFDHTALGRLRKLDANLSLGASFKRPLFALRRTESLGAQLVVPHWAFASRRFIRRAHQAGMKVVVWTVNQPGAMRRKISDGVDGIVTDYPARLAEIRTSTRIESR